MTGYRMTPKQYADDRRAYDKRQAVWKRKNAARQRRFPEELHPPCHPARSARLTGAYQEKLVSGWLVEAYRNWYDEFEENA